MCCLSTPQVVVLCKVFTIHLCEIYSTVVQTMQDESTEAYHLSGGTFNTSAVFTHQDRYVTVAMSQHLKVYATKTSQNVHSLNAGSEITSVATSAIDDRQVYTSTSNGFIQLWDVDRGQKISESKLSNAPITNIRIADRIYFYTSGKIRSVNFKFEEQTEEWSKKLTHFCVSKDGQLIMAIMKKNLFIYHKPTRKTQKYELSDDLCAIVYNDVREIVATSDITGKIHLRYATGQRSILKWHPVQVDALSFSLDGNYLFSGAHDSRIVTWKLNTNETFKIFHTTSRVKSIDVTQGLETIVVTCANNEMQVIDVTSNKEVTKISGIWKDLRQIPQNIVPSLVIEPLHGYSVFTGSNVIQWYDIYKEREEAREVIQYKAVTFDASRFGGKALECYVTGLAFSHDGQHMAHVSSILAI
jgi:WD40 repeat protein